MDEPAPLDEPLPMPLEELEGELVDDGLLPDGLELEEPLAPPTLELPLVVPDELPEDGELLLPEVEPLEPEVELAPK